MLRKKEELGVLPLFYEWVARELRPIQNNGLVRARSPHGCPCGVGRVA